MNIVLFTAEDLTAAGVVRLHGRRFRHIRDVHRASQGTELRVGELGGKMGTGRVVSIDDSCVELAVALGAEPPKALPLELVLALPRPKFVRRVLQAVTSLGIKRIDVVNSYRVEKSYWHCEQIREERVRAACLAGLEQARDTVLPDIRFHRRLKPFVEDDLAKRTSGRRCWIAHPGADRPCPAGAEDAVTLAIGPEGGWIDYEIELFRNAKFEVVHLGSRILSVETAVPALIGRLSP